MKPYTPNSDPGTAELPDREMTMEIINLDNLSALKMMRAKGEKFDLVELDGPYMAGLEGWDEMTEQEYIAHYAERLTLVKDILNPWGAVFVFGYPEGCAEIKSWSRQADTLYLRRWLTWYKQVTSHKGRKVETILFFLRDTPTTTTTTTFGQYLREQREKRGWSLRDVGEKAGRTWWHRGGNLYYENGNGGYPSLGDLFILAELFQFKIEDWPGVFFESYKGLTDIDYISRTYPEDSEKLNDNGLRSKPVQFYLDLFEPVVPPTENKKALILYAGSGNAGVAAGALGYDVTMVEMDKHRCDSIRSRYARNVEKWRKSSRLNQISMSLNDNGKQLNIEL